MTTLIEPIRTEEEIEATDAFSFGGTIDDGRQRVQDNTAFVASLREMADFFEAHPTLQSPAYPVLHVFPKDRAAMAAIAREIGGARKDYNEAYFNLDKQFGNAQVRFCIDREQVCRRIDKEIEVEESVPIGFELRTVKRTVSEWECSEPLLAA